MALRVAVVWIYSVICCSQEVLGSAASVPDPVQCSYVWLSGGDKEIRLCPLFRFSSSVWSSPASELIL